MMLLFFCGTPAYSPIISGAEGYYVSSVQKMMNRRAARIRLSSGKSK